MRWSGLGLVLLLLVGPAPALAQAVAFEGGLDLRATTYRAATDGNTVGLGGAAQTTARLYDLVLVQGEVGLDYLGPLCYDVGAACTTRRGGTPSTFVASGGVGAGVRLPLLGERPLGASLAGRVLLGREWLTGGIGADDCLNCTTDLALDGGPFLEGSLDVAAHSRLRVRLGYRTYLQGDRRGQAVLGIVSQQ